MKVTTFQVSIIICTCNRICAYVTLIAYVQIEIYKKVSINLMSTVLLKYVFMFTHYEQITNLQKYKKCWLRKQIKIVQNKFTKKINWWRQNVHIRPLKPSQSPSSFSCRRFVLLIFWINARNLKIWNFKLPKCLKFKIC